MGVGPISTLAVKTGETSSYRWNAEDRNASFPALAPGTALIKPGSETQAVVRSVLSARSTASDLALYFSPGRADWSSRIPSKALFYDEIDSISRGYRDVGIMIDRIG